MTRQHARRELPRAPEAEGSRPGGLHGHRPLPPRAGRSRPGDRRAARLRGVLQLPAAAVRRDRRGRRRAASTSTCANSSAASNDERLRTTLQSVLGLELGHRRTRARGAAGRAEAVETSTSQTSSRSTTRTKADADAALASRRSHRRRSARPLALPHTGREHRDRAPRGGGAPPDAPRRAADARRLQFLISHELGELLGSCRSSSRRLATTTASEEEWSLSGSAARSSGGEQSASARHRHPAPVRDLTRSPRLPDARKRATRDFVLDAVVLLGRQSGWHRSKSADIGKLVSSRVAEAERWLQTASLIEVERRPMTRNEACTDPQRPPPPPLSSRPRRLRPLPATRRASRPRSDPQRSRVPTDSSPETTQPLRAHLHLPTIDALRELGWQLDRLGLFAGSLDLTDKGSTADSSSRTRRLRRGLSRGSSYRAIQQAHAISPGALRPDLVIEHDHNGTPSWLLIEAKAASARRALGPRRNLRPARLPHSLRPRLAARQAPFGLGIAFGAEPHPSPASDVMLCTPNTLTTALAHFLR